MGSQVTRDVSEPWTLALVLLWLPATHSLWVIPPAPRAALIPPSTKPLVHGHLELRLITLGGPTTPLASCPTLGSSSAALNLVSPLSSPIYSPSPWAILAPSLLLPCAFSPWTLTPASALASSLSLLSFPHSAPKGSFLHQS